MERIAILTATYNHPKNLAELYNSLKKQDNKDFTWYIVDDGSKQDTEQLISLFIAEKAINIVYKRKENGGKSSAINLGLDLVHNNDFFVIVDDDEHLYPNAVSLIHNYYLKYKDTNCVCINFLRADRAGNPLCNRNAKGERLLSMQMHRRLNMKEDGYAAYFVKRLGSIRFPIFQGEKYIGPSVLMMLASRESPVLWSKTVLGTTEYLEGGITQTGRRLRLKNPKGMIFHSILMQTKDSGLFVRLAYSIHAFAYIHISNLKESDLKKEGLEINRLLPVSFLGWLTAIIWKRKYNYSR